MEVLSSDGIQTFPRIQNLFGPWESPVQCAKFFNFTSECANVAELLIGMSLLEHGFATLKSNALGSLTTFVRTCLCTLCYLSFMSEWDVRQSPHVILMWTWWYSHRLSFALCYDS